MTIGATNHALRDLGFDLLPASAGGDHNADLTLFLTAYVVKLQDKSIAFAAINTRMGC